MPGNHDEDCRDKYDYEVTTVDNLEGETVVKAITLKKFMKDSVFTASDLETIISMEFPNIPKDKLMFDMVDGSLMVLFIKEKVSGEN